MKLAIMQSYFFPYIGYFQLINAVDKFVIYDDVNYIKNGWINRNRIMISNIPKYITVPVTNASTNYLINETQIVDYQRFRKKFFKTIKFNYSKALYFDKIFNLLKEIFYKDFLYISILNTFSLFKILDYLKIKTEILTASKYLENQDLRFQERVLDICKKMNATHYINSIGGKELYKKKDFYNQGIKLNFLNTRKLMYNQFDNEFIPRLSIIDVMMFNSVETINEMLDEYELL